MTERFHSEDRPACYADDDLLRLLDGELPVERALVVREHLHACWSCRARYEDLKLTVSAFVELVDGPVRANMPQPPRQWASFRTRLRAAVDATQERATKFSWLERCIAALRPWTQVAFVPVQPAIADLFANATMRRIATSSAIAAMVGLLIVFVPASPQLSAQVILEHAMAADSDRIARVPRPVTRQRFEAHRRVNGRIVERARWELYHDVQSGRARVYATEMPSGVATTGEASGVSRRSSPALPPLAAELLGLLEAHQWNRSRPLSSASYDQWRRSFPSASTDYTIVRLDDGRKAYRVRARLPEPVRTGAIRSAGLVVRADDWHAIRQDLEVRTATGYDDIQLTEIAFDVLRFDRLDAAIFEEHAAEPSTPRHTAAPPMPSSEELDVLEMSARYELHRQGADRGEPIQVVRGPARVTVRGLVDSGARASQLETALARIPGLHVDLTAVDRVRTAPFTQTKARRRPRGVPEEPTSEEADGGTAVMYLAPLGEPPLQRAIDALLRTSEAVPDESPTGLATRRNAFIARTLDAADRAMADAWALRRLGDRYPQDAVAAMTDRSSDLLEEMVRDHVQGLIVSASAWRGELSGLAPLARASLDQGEEPGEASATRPSPLEGHVASWPTYASTIFRALERAQALTSDGLVGTHAAGSVTQSPDAAASPSDTPERRLLQLLDDLDALERTLRRVDDAARQGRRLTGGLALDESLR